MSPSGDCTILRGTYKWTTFSVEALSPTQLTNLHTERHSKMHGELTRSEVVQSMCTGCDFQFCCTQVGIAACNIAKHPRWNPNVQLKVNGNKT